MGTSPTVLMMNENTNLSSGASVEEYEHQLKEYEQQAAKTQTQHACTGSVLTIKCM